MSKPYEVGQTVTVAGGYGYHAKRTPTREGEVVTVGRKYVTVRLGGHEVRRFHLDTGTEAGDLGQPMRITTAEREAERTQVHEARARLSRELTVYGSGIYSLSLPALLEVERIVRADRERTNP